MKKVFDKIKTEAEKNKKVRYPTSIKGVQTQEDIILVIECILGVLEDLDKRISKLEK